MPAENIKVAVRVRCANDREKNDKMVVTMDGNQTILAPKDTEGRNSNERKFAFDYSYWSFDGFKNEEDGYSAPDSSHPNGYKYADQRKVFSDLGLGILTNAWDGYNASLFAYGQTGSGKTYSMTGYGVNKGVIPLLAEGLFSQIEKEKSSKDNQLEVSFSMVEIYNEIVTDLLSKKQDRKGLQLHESPDRGFFILEKDLKPTPICDYASFDKLIQQGTANKTIAATKMNSTSSRAHTIAEVTFKQTFKNETGKEMQRVSVIKLIDLAGSERADKSGTSGDRFKEGVAINLSLTALGNCISKLAEVAGGKDVRIPYRDSILTKILMNVLGGNSKTIMIAAISPANNNYDETLSTLRYADRAKQIKCNAKVNEDPKDKLIRQLQEEINSLKERMKNGGSIVEVGDNLPKSEYERLKKEMEESMKKQIENSEKEILAMKKSYEEKLSEAQNKAKEIAKYNVSEKASSTPHLSNISSDPMLTGSLKHLLEVNAKKSKLVLGASDKVDIQLYGLGIQDRHCCISLENDKFYLEPYTNARVVRNGRPNDQKFLLENLDRLVFGASLYYIFVNPSEFTVNGEKSFEVMTAQVNTITYEKIHQEIAEESGLISEADINRQKPDEIACLQELIDLIPYIEEANQMSILLDKKVKYKPIILNPLLVGEPHSKVRPVVVLKKFGTPLEWIWDKYKFVDRKSFMSEMYLDIKEDGKANKNVFQNFDPFFDNENEPVLIGTAVFEPKCILHNIPLQENIKIYDYKSRLSGTLSVEMIPCDKNGQVYKNIADVIVHKPEVQLKKLNFLMRINTIRCMQPKYRNIFCQYKLFGDEDFYKTESGKDTNNPDINDQRLVSYDTIPQDLIKTYVNQSVFIQVYGVQKYVSNESNKYTTKQWFENESKAKQNSIELLRDEINKMKDELEKHKKKFKNLETLLDYAEKKKSKSRIKIEYVRECMLSSNPDVLTKLFDVINKSNE